MPNRNVSTKHLCRDVEAIPRQGSQKVHWNTTGKTRVQIPGKHAEPSRSGGHLSPALKRLWTGEEAS